MALTLALIFGVASILLLAGVALIADALFRLLGARRGLQFRPRASQYTPVPKT